MIAPERMRKLSIIGPKTRLKTIVETLHEMNVYHIREHVKDEQFDIGSPMEQSDELSEELVRVRSLLSNLGIGKKQDAEAREPSMADIKKRSKKLAETVSGLVDKKKAAEARLNQLSSKRSKLQMLAGFDVPVKVFFSSTSLVCYAGTAERGIEDEVANITSRYSYHEKAGKDRVRFVLLADQAKEKELDELLQKRSYSPLDLKELEGMAGTPDKLLQKVEEDIAAEKEEIEALERKLAEHRQKEEGFLIGAERVLARELEKQEAPLRFGATRQVFVVNGWVPEKDVKRVREEVEKRAKGAVEFHVEDVRRGEDAPVKLANPAVVRPYEFLLKLFSWPRYGEIDPSFLMVFTIPLFFGMMLGDMGYGALTLITFTILRFKFKQFAPLFNILIMASISTIVFGFLYGEVFGMEEPFGYHLWHVLSRTHDFNSLLYLSVIIGLVHVNLGFILGFINEFRSHGFWTALTHKGSWMLVEVAVLFWYLTSSLAPASFPWFVAAVFTSVVALVLLYKGEGFMGIIELPSLLSHVVSYARIMAVGLASVFLAILVNDAATALWEAGLVAFILGGIPVLLIGHGFNIALGTFSPFLHSIRLHYVEFFTKFYKGGGQEYTPFGAKHDQGG